MQQAARWPVRAVLVLLATWMMVSATSAEPDERAVAVAEHLLDAMGGKVALDAQRILAFRFAVERGGEEVVNWLHIWDRYTGQYRLEGEKDGFHVRVLFNLNRDGGDVWVGGEKVEGEDAAAYLKMAHERHINDTYWLLMPWKWLDPGVHLAYEGERTRDGRVYDVVRLSFDPGIGLTSNDVYWGFVSRETGLMEHWEFVLQTGDGQPGDGPPTAFDWEGWVEREDGLRFSTRKTRAGSDGETAIVFPMLQMSREPNPEVFDPPPPPAGAPPTGASGTPPVEAGLRTVLVVLNKSEHTAALVDPETGRVVRTVPTGVGPHEGAVSRDGKTLYVANYGTFKPGNTLSVISVPTGRVERVVDLGENGRPHGILVGPDGSVWVTTEESRSLLRLDPGDLAIRNQFVTGEEVTHMVVLSPDGSRAFTANIGSGTVSVVDVAEGAVRNIETGRGPEGIDITPDGTEVWVAHREDDNVVILDTESLEMKEAISTGEFPIRVKITPDGSRALVSCAASNELVVYDVRSRRELGRVELDETPIGILVTPDGSRAYVANTGADKVSVVDLGAMEVAGWVAPGREPDGMAWATW